jgi:hypothetical protein
MNSELLVTCATPFDAADLLRLARLENRHSFPDRALIARQDGVAVAAIALEGGDVVADPFRPTAAIVAALRALAAGETGATNGAARADSALCAPRHGPPRLLLR